MRTMSLTSTRRTTLTRKPTPFPSEPAIPTRIHTQKIPKIENLRQENTDLKKRVEELEAEVESLKRQSRISFPATE